MSKCSIHVILTDVLEFHSRPDYEDDDSSSTESFSDSDYYNYYDDNSISSLLANLLGGSLLTPEYGTYEVELYDYNTTGMLLFIFLPGIRTVTEFHTHVSHTRMFTIVLRSSEYTVVKL